MRLALFLILLVLVAGVGALVTRPGPEAFDRLLEVQIRDRVANTDIGAGGEVLPTVALAACKLRPSDCVSVVRRTLQVTFEERPFFTRATVQGFGRTTTCIGAFTRFVCRRPVIE